MKKILTKEKLLVREDVKEEVELFEEPRFYQHHNFREVVAIIPEPYNYTEDCFGVSYNIYSAADGQVKNFNIGCNDLFRATGGSNRNNAYECIERNYSSTITEETFFKYYNEYLRKCTFVSIPPIVTRTL